jgi:hypothetical protein
LAGDSDVHEVDKGLSSYIHSELTAEDDGVDWLVVRDLDELLIVAPFLLDFKLYELKESSTFSFFLDNGVMLGESK